jgi:hypothetical protein
VDTEQDFCWALVQAIKKAKQSVLKCARPNESDSIILQKQRTACAVVLMNR